MRTRNLFNSDMTWSHRKATQEFFINDEFEDFDRLVNSFLQPTSPVSVSFRPSCDIKETKEHYLVRFDMPGVKKENIKIEIEDNQLIVSGERNYDQKEEVEATIRNECVYGKFNRTFMLPSTVNAEKIEAHYENGVLSIAIPKSESAKGKTIQIQSGQNSFFSKLLGSKKEVEKDLKDIKVN